MSHQADFVQLHQVLSSYQAYWKLMPFACDTQPWQDPALQAKLAALSDDAIAELDRDPIARQAWFIECFPKLAQLPELPAFDPRQPEPELPFWLSNGIPGRKVGQIQQFCAMLPESKLPVLEWCAGKGHLGRMLAYSQQREVISLEWQATLCEQGQQLARQYQLPQRFVQADALSSQGLAMLAPQQQVVALHACGELHLQLLRSASQQGCQQLQLVPCCYHLIPEQQYQPLSQVAQQHDLALSQHDLKLAVQGQVTAGARIARLRQTEVEWRLAWQALRTELSGDSNYQPLASVSKQIFSTDFLSFAKWAAGQHQLVLPAGLKLDGYLAQGQAHARLVRRIELVRHLFQRPLELWLLYDRALFLEQQGYQVELGTFCAPSLTPRNLMLRAHRQIQ
ncbi:methyltransferase [Alkalimonas amylolytica]|uniref:Methyltransferase domain-containing protein n=1 Tax=Alkalimonas amylolytica TaxID=152573 RepID=A0A1H4D9G5_ALKAM|nr:methyltransferase [Alkalimonas amylolytica]SEA69059.1 Methyltransferase domain-containing protein [Alkalimonas amylolytica]